MTVRRSDAIAAYLEQLLARAPEGYIDIQRAQVAQLFECVPSQVTYVLMTRFSAERGYRVEGRRGGGGGIRLSRLQAQGRELLGAIDLADGIDQGRAEAIVERALAAGAIDRAQAEVMKAAVDREVLGGTLPERDRLRARLLRAMLVAALGPKGA